VAIGGLTPHVSLRHEGRNAVEDALHRVSGDGELMILVSACRQIRQHEMVKAPPVSIPIQMFFIGFFSLDSPVGRTPAPCQINLPAVARPSRYVQGAQEVLARGEHTIRAERCATTAGFQPSRTPYLTIIALLCAGNHPEENR
jgi:hypothetical protein